MSDTQKPSTANSAGTDKQPKVEDIESTELTPEEQEKVKGGLGTTRSASGFN